MTGSLNYSGRLTTDIDPEYGKLWIGNINVVPKREWDERKK
ncbi:MAG TPA: hypothetical protein VGH64_14355 [Puia sp.]